MSPQDLLLPTPLMSLCSSLCLSFSPYPVHTSSNSIFPPCLFVVNTAFSLCLRISPVSGEYHVSFSKSLSKLCMPPSIPSSSLPWRNPGGFGWCVDLYSESSPHPHPHGACAWQGDSQIRAGIVLSKADITWAQEHMGSECRPGAIALFLSMALLSPHGLANMF